MISVFYNQPGNFVHITLLDNLADLIMVHSLLEPRPKIFDLNPCIFGGNRNKFLRIQLLENVTGSSKQLNCNIHITLDTTATAMGHLNQYFYTSIFGYTHLQPKGGQFICLWPSLTLSSSSLSLISMKPMCSLPPK